MASFAFALLQLGGLNLWFAPPAFAATNLSIEPLTWDFIGLDSNNTSVGPNQYLVGARVCNIGSEAAQNVAVRFVREGSYNPYLTIVNSLNTDTWSIASLPPGALPPNHHRVAAKPANCFDAYYNVTVARTAAAYNTTQRYRIEASASNAAVVDTNSFPDPGQYDTGHPRQLYVEKILSQARNDVLNFENVTTPGSMSVEVGGTYTFRLTSQTATAYPQLTISSDFPNIVFQILNVTTRYSSDPGLTNSSIYANACGWISDPTYPGYRASSSTCTYPPIPDQDTSGDGKVGNIVTTEYTIRILSSGPGGPANAQYNINHLILDFSGGSYHYNADYGSGVGVGQTAITVVSSSADLSLAKTHAGNFSIGNNNYTLTVTNTGSTARGPITVTDTLPSGFSFVSATGTGWTCSANGQIVTCTRSTDLASGSSSTITLTVGVNTSAASNSVNTATVSSSTPDPNLNNNTAADPTTVIQGPNISLTKDDNQDDPIEETFVVGSTATYRLAVSNTSGFNAAGPLTIIDTLPNGLSYTSVSGTGWTCSANGQTVVCTNPNGLTNGQTSALSLGVNVLSNAATSVTNTATVSSGSFDTNSADNTASQINTVNKPLPDLVISKTDNDQQFAVSQNGTYTMTVTNQGFASTLDTITVVDNLPSSLTFVSAASAVGSTGWSCSASGQTVTCTNNNPLEVNGKTAILLTVRPTVAVAAPGVTNTATVSMAPGLEGNTGNNSGSDQTPILSAGGINLSVVKKLTQINGAAPSPACATSGQVDTCTATVNPGSSIEYTVDVINNSSGNGDDTNITLKDTVPPEIINVTWVCDYVDGNQVAGGSSGNPSPPKALGTGNGVNACNPNNTSGTPLYRATGSGSNNISLSTISLRKAGGKVRFTIKGNIQSSGFTGNFSNSATATPSAASGADSNLADNTYTVNATIQGADVSLSKTNFTNLAQGVDGIYRLTVTNTSTNSARPTTGIITVQDTLPSNLGFVSASSAPGSSGWSCNYSSTTRVVTCVTSQVLNGGQTSAIDITVKPAVTSSAYSVTNSASVSSKGDTNLSNNNASSTTTVAVANPDLKITKADLGNFALGQEGTYILTVQNVGTTVAVAPITVTDTLPNGLSFLSGSGSGWTCSASGQNITCKNYSNIAAGGSSVLNLKVLVGSTAPASVSNTAIVATVSGETVTTNNTSNTLTTTVAQRADLGVTKVLSGSLIKDQNASYTLTVTNNGPSAIPSTVTVTDTLPSGLSFVSGSGGGFTCTAGSPVTCTKTNGLAVGASSTITLTTLVTANAGASLTNTAQVTSSLSDPVTSNNTANRTDTVQAQTIALAIDKSHFGSFPLGGYGTYTLEVKNTGNATITQPIRITDTLPSNLSLTSAVGQGWTCSGTTSVTCTTDEDLAPGATNAVDLVVLVGAGTPVGTNSITNSASVFIGSSSSPASTDSDPTTIATSADLSVTKTAATSFVVGQQAQYIITVANAASSAGTVSGPITIEDQLPTGLSYVSGTGTNWTCPATSTSPDITCTLNSSLAPGASSSLTLTVKVDSTISSPFNNYVTTYSATPDPNTANNTAIATNSTSTSSGTADITIAKSDAPDPATIGNALTYTLTATNRDTANSATNVVVSDTLPSSVTYQSATASQGTCSQSNGTVTCNLGAIAPSSNATVTIGVRPTISGTITNSASVASSNDSNTSNNTATAGTVVNAAGTVNTISGKVFLDSDRNGSLNGSEAGTAASTIQLYRDVNNDGILDGGDILLTSQETNSSGDYTFAVSVTGNYILTLDLSDPDLGSGQLITTNPLPRISFAVIDGTVSSNRNIGHNSSVVGAPQLMLVKRITAINNTLFTDIVDGVDNPSSPNYVAAPQNTDDNHPNWPANFLKGRITENIRPNDEVEYTIYFLSTGNLPAQNVLFCDLVPTNLSFTKAGYNSVSAAAGPSPVPGVSQSGDRGIMLSLGTQSATSPYPINVSLTNVADTDVGRYVEPGVSLTGLDSRLSNCGSNTNGAIVVDLKDLPHATSAGSPANSYGFVRFRGRVN